MLRIEGLRAGYGRATVLHGVSLAVPEAGVAAVLGHNGAGKSTLLRAALGLLRPRTGRVLFGGADVTGLPAHERVRRGMAYVPQGQQSFPRLTTLENLRLVAEAHHGGAAVRAAVDEALDRFPALREAAARPAGLLSGGQRQQLALARALVTRPRLLLLDEPTEGIQPSVVAQIQRTVTALAGEGLAVLLVEQHLDFALRAAST
jgi:urea transport system ATP-binding protein